jgi:hypothetical protein
MEGSLGGIHGSFPGGRRFAFSILDDTDDSTLENVRPVYDRLRELGLRTTKTVWPLDCPEGSRLYFAADTLQRREYLEFVHSLVSAGFELASHGATMESSDRERTLRGLAFLEREFGFVPRLHANHGQNRESVYWGAERFRTPWLRALLRQFSRTMDAFDGERPDSPYFWGDVCRERFDYVRGFTFSGLNALRLNPEMPYTTACTPYVRRWFSTTDAPDAKAFLHRVTPAALERLEAQAGVCIVSTHLGKGFVEDGRLRGDVDAVLTSLARRPGWFAPVSDILDHLRGSNDAPLGARALLRLELRYLADRVRSRVRESTLRALGGARRTADR